MDITWVDGEWDTPEGQIFPRSRQGHKSSQNKNLSKSDRMLARGFPRGRKRRDQKSYQNNYLRNGADTRKQKQRCLHDVYKSKR